MEGMDADQEKIGRNSGKFEGAKRPHMMFFEDFMDTASPEPFFSQRPVSLGHRAWDLRRGSARHIHQAQSLGPLWHD